MFFSLKFAFFLKYYVCEKTHFSKGISGDLLLNKKLKKPFVSLSDEVTIIALFSYYCFVSASGQGAKRGRFEFVLPRHRFDTRSLNYFFRSVPLVL